LDHAFFSFFAADGVRSSNADFGNVGVCTHKL
jgi:hypothetical protein